MGTAGIVTLCVIGVVVALLLVFLPKIAAGLGWTNATAALDKVTTALHSAFTAVESKTLLSYLGRSKLIDLLVWLEVIIKLLPGEQQTKAMQARNDLIDVFKSAPVYPANTQPVAPAQPPIS